MLIVLRKTTGEKLKNNDYKYDALSSFVSVKPQSRTPQAPAQPVEDP